MNRIERLELDLYNSSYEKMYNKIYNHDIDDAYMSVVQQTADTIAETNPIMDNYTYLYDLIINQFRDTLDLTTTYDEYLNWTYDKPLDYEDYVTIRYYNQIVMKYFEDVYREYFVYNREQRYKIQTELLTQYPDITIQGEENKFYIYYDEDNVPLTFIFADNSWLQISNDSEVTDITSGVLAKVVALLENANLYIELCENLSDNTIVLADNITQLYNDANYLIRTNQGISIKSFTKPDQFLDLRQFVGVGEKGETGDRGINGVYEQLNITDNTISIANNTVTLKELDSNEVSETLLIRPIENGLALLNNNDGFVLDCGKGEKGDTGSTGNTRFDVSINNNTLTIRTDEILQSYTYSDIFTNENEVNITWVGNYYDDNYNYAIVSDINKDSGVEQDISSETLVAFGETDLETQFGNVSFDYWDIYDGEITYTGADNYLGRIALPYEQSDPQNYLTEIKAIDDNLYIKLSNNTDFTLPLSYKYSNVIHYDFDIDTVTFDFGGDQAIKRIQKGITDLFYTQSHNEKPTNVGLIVDNKDFIHFGIENNLNNISFAISSYSTPENVFTSTLTVDGEYIVEIPEIKDETFVGYKGKGFNPIIRDNKVIIDNNLELPLTLTSYYEFVNDTNNVTLTQYYHDDKIQKQLTFNKDFYGENSDIGIQYITIESTDYGTLVNLITNDSTIPLTIYNIIGYDNIVTFDNTSIYVDNELQITIEEQSPIYKLVDYTENIDSYVLNFTNNYHYPISNATIVGNYVTEFTNSRSIVGTNCANNDNTITEYKISEYFAGSCIDMNTTVKIENDLAIDITIHCITDNDVIVTSIAPNSTFEINSTMYMWYVLKVGKETEKILEREEV